MVAISAMNSLHHDRKYHLVDVLPHFEVYTNRGAWCTSPTSNIPSCPRFHRLPYMVRRDLMGPLTAWVARYSTGRLSPDGTVVGTARYGYHVHAVTPKIYQDFTGTTGFHNLQRTSCSQVLAWIYTSAIIMAHRRRVIVESSSSSDSDADSDFSSASSHKTSPSSRKEKCESSDDDNDNNAKCSKRPRS
ncbi:hypothetical protein CY34DRAFT_591030 [Suillus luteus UH-Slu-Lm8-n1]|uniref:Uncharacterized protein n=1 Tax=Suillus luteus UH-Slu-Lm8-n1 TaxID=930992 RepID=A0A0C9ZCM3_9AGAM|nr:hypothetical protein CY34DRAFT_591030 [Suillus luteus UH-Slu-Lm8-n1]